MMQCPNCEQKDRVTIGKRVFCANCGSLWSGNDDQTNALDNANHKIDGLANNSSPQNIAQKTDVAPPAEKKDYQTNITPVSPASPIIPEQPSPALIQKDTMPPVAFSKPVPSQPTQPSKSAQSTSQASFSVASQSQRIERAKNIGQSPSVRKFSAKQTSPQTSQPNNVLSQDAPTSSNPAGLEPVSNTAPPIQNKLAQPTPAQVAPIHQQPVEAIDLSNFIKQELADEQKVVDKEKQLAKSEVKTTMEPNLLQENLVQETAAKPDQVVDANNLQAKSQGEPTLSAAPKLGQKLPSGTIKPEIGTKIEPDIKQTQTSLNKEISIKDLKPVSNDEDKKALQKDTKLVSELSDHNAKQDKTDKRFVIEEKQELTAPSEDLLSDLKNVVKSDEKNAVVAPAGKEKAKSQTEPKFEKSKPAPDLATKQPTIVKHKKIKPFSDVKLKENIGSEIGSLEPKANGVLSDEEIDNFNKIDKEAPHDAKSSIEEKHHNNIITPSTRFEPQKPEAFKAKSDKIEAESQGQGSEPKPKPLTIYQTGISPEDMKITQQHHWHPGDQVQPDKKFVPEPTQRQNGRNSKLNLKAKGLALTTVGVLIIAAYVWQMNYPNLAMKVASARSGINVSLPTYIPNGWRVSSDVKSEPGKVSYDLTNANEKSDKISITQSRTDWDSQALAENYLSSNSSNYSALQSQGLTIYLFGSSQASWINHGNWYKIDASSKVSQDQILKIATSL